MNIVKTWNMHLNHFQVLIHTHPNRSFRILFQSYSVRILIELLPWFILFSFIDHANSADFSVLNAIKKKEDNNLIDLTLFKEAASSTSITSDGDVDWDLKAEQNKSIDVKIFNNEKRTNDREQECGRVRHSVLEAFDPLLKPNCCFQTNDLPSSAGMNPFSSFFKFNERT